MAKVIQKMNRLELGILIIVQLLLSVVVILRGVEGVDKGFPAWLAAILISAWIILCIEIDIHICKTDL
jgi:membrane protein required for beta-lactamase induction